MLKKFISLFVAVAMILSFGVVAYADGNGNEKGYLVLGEDLTEKQKDIVFGLLHVNKNELDQYSVSYGTNKQEHEAFDSYLSQSVIGKKAISSILMVPAEKGAGINVTSNNINYCTTEMYQNALISAGVEDVDVYIAAPYPVSGTCALVGAMNAYTTLTGVEIEKTTADAASNELVTTGKVGEAVGDNDKAAEAIAAMKQKVAENDKELSEDELNDTVDSVCNEYKITIDDDLKKELIALLQKLQKTDLNANSLRSQAGDLYDKIDSAISGLNETSKHLQETEKESHNFIYKMWKMVCDLFAGFLHSNNDSDKTAADSSANTSSEATTSEQSNTASSEEDSDSNESPSVMGSENETEAEDKNTGNSSIGNSNNQENNSNQIENSNSENVGSADVGEDVNGDASESSVTEDVSAD